MKNKTVHHICIQTNDYASSMNFYTKIMGFELVKEEANFHGRDFNTWLRLGSFMIELQTPKKGDILNKWSSSNEGIAHICFLVEDIKGEYEEIKNAGYNDFKLKNGEVIYKVEDGYLFKVIAPEGTIIEIRDNPDL